MICTHAPVGKRHFPQPAKQEHKKRKGRDSMQCEERACRELASGRTERLALARRERVESGSAERLARVRRERVAICRRRHVASLTEES